MSLDALNGSGKTEAADSTYPSPRIFPTSLGSGRVAEGVEALLATPSFLPAADDLFSSRQIRGLQIRR